ncbi:MAG: gliding motility-associated C-terminal domain-containing protein [Panacibacter sp.]
MKKEKIHTLLITSGMLVFFLIVSFFSFGQCATAISNFPYSENFETSNGNWVAGGNAPDWAWGTPIKKTISAAASGSKCWITGGLNKSAYNDGENSWLRSPCFNFSNVKNPYIKFNVFWETSLKDDGVNLQYSINNGTTWILAGAANEPNGCLTEQWYNTQSLENVNRQDAWSGNIQSSHPGCIVSGGSITWVTAKHAMPELAGQPNVLFRFVFGSGAGCNDFDGFAVDDFSIEEAPSSVASFKYKCSSNLRVNFENTSTLCPTNFLWNFDDPSSGLENTSTSPTPTHAYTLGGNYHVSLTVSGPGNNSSTYELPNLEIITDIKAVIVNPIRCYDDTTGVLSVNFIGDTTGISYKWNSDPVQTTRTATHLGAGDYNITILNAEGCPASANVSLGEPPPLLHTISLVKPDCTASNGNISITMSGGVSPYNYSWSPNVSNTSSAKNLPSGTYTVTVTDNNQCYKVINIDLPGAGDLEAVITNNKNVSCFGANDGAATVTAKTGAAPYTYSWPLPGSNVQTLNNLSAGSYNAIVTDAKGCKAFAIAVITQPQQLTSAINLQSTSCGNSNGNASVIVNGGTAPYQYTWNTGNNTNAINSLSPGKYIVSIKDNNGCIKNDTANIGASTAVQVQLSHTDVLCAGNKTGSAEAVITGGTQPYTFQWMNGTQSFIENSISSIGAGTYNFNVQDAVGCSINTSVLVKEPEALKIEFTTQPSYCDFSNGNANAMVSGGLQPYSFSWLPQGTTTTTLSNVPAGNYQFTVTDKNSCTASLVTTILNTKPASIFLGNDTTLCPGNSIVLSPGIYSKYRWQDNSGMPGFTVLNAGTYFVHVTDNLGCVIKDTIKIIGDCGYIFFPTAFTPNNDRHNDFFGPFGVLSTVKDYSLVVYNRLGQLIFKSNDPLKKWDGKLQGNSPVSGTYVWIAMYSNKGETGIVQKGTVTIIY